MRVAEEITDRDLTSVHPTGLKSYFLRIPVGKLVVVSGLFTSLLLSVFLYQALSSERRRAFEAMANDYQERLQTRVRLYEISLLSIQSFLHSRGQLADLSAVEGRLTEYIEKLEFLRIYRGSLGLGLLTKVTPNQVAAHEAVHKGKYGPNYSIWPKGKRDLYFPVSQIAPLRLFPGKLRDENEPLPESLEKLAERLGKQGAVEQALIPHTARVSTPDEASSDPFLEAAKRNIRALGFDMYNDAARGAAMDRARMLGTVATSTPIELVQEVGLQKQWGFSMFAPVFSNGKWMNKKAEDEKNLVGFLYAPFRIGDFVAATIPFPLPKPMSRFQVIYDDETIPVALRNLFDTKIDSPAVTMAASAWGNSLDLSMNLPGSERGFILRFFVEREPLSSYVYVLPLSALALGLLMTYVISRLIGIREDFGRTLESTVLIRTEKLRKTLTDQETANARLVAMNEDLEAFSYSVSHDLRTPLRGIDGFGKALVEDYGSVIDEGGQKYIEFIRKSAQRAGAIIDDLLRLSRISQSELTRSKVDLGRVASEVMSVLRDQDGQRKLEFRKEGSLECVCDERLLRIVLENILGNAWKFSKNVEHALVVFRGEETAAEWVFCVEDNGAGFSMEYAGKLFGVYQRLHTEKEFLGSGVGLAIVKRIITRHGGRIWANAEKNKGARISFTIPKKC